MVNSNEPGRITSWRIPTLAFAVAALSIVSALAIAFVSYRHSLDETERGYHQFYLQEAQMLATLADRHQNLNDRELLRLIQETWEMQQSKPPDEYICIVDRGTRLILHTIHPGTVGKYVGENLVVGAEGEPSCRLTDLVDAQKNYVGDYVSSAGQSQIAAFVSIPSRHWVLGLHRSEQALVDDIENDVRFLKYGFLIVCGLLMPASLVTIYITFRVVQKRRMSVEETLKQSEARFRRLAENAVDMIYRMSLPDGRYEYVSPASELLFGYTPNEFYDRPRLIRDIVHPDWQSRFEEQWGKVLQGDTEPIPEFQIVHKSGDTRWMYQRSVLVHDETGEPIAIEGIVSDVTERVQSEEREQALQECVQTQEKHAAVGQLAAGVAHDFNNMLTGVMGYAELALTTPDLPSEIRSYILAIQKQGGRAAHLVKQILDFSRKSIIQKYLIDLFSLLEETTELLRHTIPENITIHLETDPDIGLVEADGTQIQQAIMNLAVNARDAMPEGGSLTFHLSSRIFESEDAVPFPGLMPPGDWVVLSVSDTGMGIPDEILPRLYEPFFTTKEVGQGTGLGLSQVYGIVMQHEGFIDVQSRVGEGSTFRVYLPAKEMAAKPAQAEEPGELPTGQGRTILVVEDEPTVLNTIQRMLEALDYQLMTASNGKEAWAIYQQHHGSIDLVLSDVVMPEMGGLELYQLLHQLNNSIKAVMMSGYPLRDESLPDTVGWLRKPVSLDSLARVIHTMLRH